MRSDVQASLVTQALLAFRRPCANEGDIGCFCLPLRLVDEAQRRDLVTIRLERTAYDRRPERNGGIIGQISVRISDQEFGAAEYTDESIWTDEQAGLLEAFADACIGRGSLGSIAPPGSVHRSVSASRPMSSRFWSSKIEIDAAAVASRSWPILSRTAFR